VSVRNTNLTHGDEVFRTDSPNAKVTFDNVELNNVNFDACGPRGMEVIGSEKVGWL